MGVEVRSSRVQAIAWLQNALGRAPTHTIYCVTPHCFHGCSCARGRPSWRKPSLSQSSHKQGVGCRCELGPIPHAGDAPPNRVARSMTPPPTEAPRPRKRASTSKAQMRNGSPRVQGLGRPSHGRRDQASANRVPSLNKRRALVSSAVGQALGASGGCARKARARPPTPATRGNAEGAGPPSERTQTSGRKVEARKRGSGLHHDRQASPGTPAKAWRGKRASRQKSWNNITSSRPPPQKSILVTMARLTDRC